MKITAENGDAKVEVTIRVSSPNKALVLDEIKALRLNLGDRCIKSLTDTPYTKFSLSNKEIKVT